MTGVPVRENPAGSSLPRGLTVLRPRRRLSLLLHRRSAAVAVGLLGLLALVMGVSACVGQTFISPEDVWATVRTGGGAYAW